MRTVIQNISIAVKAAGLALCVTASSGAEWQQRDGFRFSEVLAPSAGRTNGGFTEIAATQSGITFTNSVPPRLLTENQNLMNGAGLALGDFDGDGLCDVYLCALNGTNALYRNRGDWKFENVTATAGVGCAGMRSTGALFSDLDGDGDLDLVVATLGTGTHSFENNGEGRFSETTRAAGLTSQTGSTSLATADVDGDGDLDLYVTNYGAQSILRSGGRAEMKRIGNQWIVTGPYASRLRFVDGRLEEVGEADVLYLNDGKGHFRAVPWDSEFFLNEKGERMPEPVDYGLSVQMRDINADGHPDIYVCNDFQTVDRIWLNDGRGRFRALPRLAMRKQSFSSMGVDFADIDRDGHFDFFVTEMMSREHARRMRQVTGNHPAVPMPGALENRPEVVRNTLYRNRGDTTYAEIANFAGVPASDWAWHPVFMDVDLDGYEDLLVVNGIAFDVQDRDVLQQIRSLGQQTAEQSRSNLLMYPAFFSPNIAYRNERGLTFADSSDAWGFNSRRISHSAALADFDNDGDPDIAVNCFNDAPLFYRNDTTAPRIAVRLKGQPPNPQGIGSLIRVHGGAVPMQMQEVISGGRYLAGDDALRVFAGGAATNALSIEVTWRSGAKSKVTNATANCVYIIEEPNAAANTAVRAGSGSRSGETNATPLFKDVSPILGHVHHETLFNDFVRQPLLMKLLSQAGPGVGWIDLDADGIDELIVGSGKGGTLKAFRRADSGVFRAIELSTPFAATDDLCGIAGWFSDAGDPAVLVALANYESGSASNSAPVLFARTTGSRLHIQEVDTAGTFEATPGPLATADIDGDGDLDLFVGGRVIPGAYPKPATSKIFRQDKGRLVPDEGTNSVLNAVGLVNGAVWSDLNADGFPELILACEWGPVRVFHSDRGKLREVTSELGLAAHTGWWNGVATGDFDEDGQLDIVATNWGLNDAYRPSPEHPLEWCYGDMMGNGMIHLIESYYDPELGANVPRRSLNALSQAFPMVADHFPSHGIFSKTTIEQMVRVLRFPPERVRASTLASMLFLNRTTNFIAVPLPTEAQLAPAFAVNVADADGDGHEDIFLSQNFFATRAEWPRLDAGRGLWLRGNGRGEFVPISGQESGVKLYGEQRGAAVCDFNKDGRIDLAVTQNGAATMLFENAGAKPGLRVALKGVKGNPAGYGAVLRLEYEKTHGPAREIHGGSGYWSQDSAVQVLGLSDTTRAIHVTWPGGQKTRSELPADANDVIISPDGKLSVIPANPQ